MSTRAEALRAAARVGLGIVLGVLVLSGSIARAQPAPSRAPLNPDFISYQRERAAGHVATVAGDGHALGYIPPPVDMSHIARSVRPMQAFPAAFDLRYQPLTRVTPVRDQKTCAACWAFAALASLESCLLPGELWDFSENNLKNTHGFDWSHCSGGNAFMATAYLARWGGPVSESDDPYDPDSGNSPLALPVRKHVQEVLFLARDPNEAKWAVWNHGALACSYYHSSDEQYFNPTYNAYYYNGSATTNHEVAIVGWDDNYPGARFKIPPPGNGAWIVKNSGGTAWGDGGYHYISYYDTKIGQFVLCRNAEPVTNYDRIHQHDPLGHTGSRGYGAGVPIWVSNVFAASQPERLSAIAFYALDSVGSYDASVYRGVAAAPTSGTLAASFSGVFSHAGYLTVPLPSPVDLNTGEKFSVVLRLNTPDYAYPAAVETAVAGFSSQATASPGESYYSNGGTSWRDLTADDPTGNFCIKAFTVNAAHHTVTGIAPNTGPNSGPVDVTITGTGFEAGATAQLSGAAGTSVSGTNVVVVSATQITCRFELLGAVTGAWNVEVTNPGAVTAQLTNGFTIFDPGKAPPPTVTGITPNPSPNNAAVGVTIAGTGFLPGATAKLTRSGQAEISGTGLAVVSATQIICQLNLTGVVKGAWDVVVVNGDGQEGSLSEGFTVSAAPTGPVDEDFETGGLSKWPWVTVGDTNWHVATTDNNTGTYAAQAGGITHNQSAYLEVTLTCQAGNTSFYKRVSSEADRDFLRFSVDGAELGAWSGDGAWNVAPHSYAVPAGTHTFRWEYAKNGSVSSHEDTAWVDDITFPPMAAPAVTVSAIDPASGANDGAVDVTIGGTSFQAGATTRLAKAGAPAIDGTNVVVASPTQITCRFDLHGVATGAWDVEVTNPGATPGQLLNGFTVTQSPGAVDEDFETGDFSKWPWVTGGDANWHVTDGDKHSGTHSARAGAIDNSQSTYLEVTRNCQAGNISFFKKVASSWLGGNWLIFSVDGVEAGRWSGQPYDDRWQDTPHAFAVPAGTHTFRWEYEKDGLVIGEDTAWVDDITFPPLAPPGVTVTAITPNSGVNDAPVDVTIDGSGFQAGATARLTRAGVPSISGTNVAVVSSAQVTCRFELQGAAAGAWDVEVANGDGQTGSLAGGFAVVAAHAVTITAGPQGAPNPVTPGGAVACSVTAGDSHGHALRYAWAATGGSFDDPAAQNPTWTAPSQLGDCNVSVTVTCGEDASVSQTASYVQTVTAVHAVEITAGPQGAPNPVTPGGTVACTVTGQDSRGHVLHYAWAATGGSFNDPTAQNPTWTAPDQLGAYDVTVTVTCGEDASVNETASYTQDVSLHHTFAGGLHMVSVPVIPTNPDPAQAGFDATRWARWDPGVEGYRVHPHAYTMFTPAESVPGKGYWARFATATEVHVPGVPPATAAYTVQVPAGWTQIGNPRVDDMPWSITGAGALRVRRGGDEMTLAQAQTAGWCEDFAWGYGPDAGYELVYDPAVAAVGEREALAAWEGYWFLAHRAVELVFPVAETAAAASARPPAQRAEGEWRVALIAALEDGSAAQAVVGQAVAARSMELPPGFGGGVELSVVAGSRRLGLDLREQGEAPVWALKATTNAPDAKVTLRWPDLSQMPREYRPVLIDTETGKRTYMRTSRGYTYTPGAAGTRCFEVHTAPTGAASLAATGVTAAMAGGGNVEVRVTLSAAATVDADVVNMAGRQVGTICRAREMETGSAVVLWGATSDRGTRLPSGRYLIRVSARAEDGQQTGAIAPLQLVR